MACGSLAPALDGQACWPLRAPEKYGACSMPALADGMVLSGAGAEAVMRMALEACVTAGACTGVDACVVSVMPKVLWWAGVGVVGLKRSCWNACTTGSQHATLVAGFEVPHEN